MADDEHFPSFCHVLKMPVGFSTRAEIIVVVTSETHLGS